MQYVMVMVLLLAGSAGALGRTSGEDGKNPRPVAFEEFAEAYRERWCDGLAECTQAEIVAKRFASIDLGVYHIACPPETLEDKGWWSEIGPVFRGLLDAQRHLARWMHPGADALATLEADVATLEAWIGKLKPKQLRGLSEAEDKRLLVYLEAPEEVRQASERLARVTRRGGELGLPMVIDERVDIVFTPTRLDFIQTVSFLGSRDEQFKKTNWVPGIDEWTQTWDGWTLLVALEYSPWGGFDARFRTSKPMRELEKTGMVQQILQQASLAHLFIGYGRPEPRLVEQSIALNLVIEVCGRINTIDNERGISTSGASTAPYERFVPGGNPNGGTLPPISAAPMNMIIESAWRKGHGEDHFLKPLQRGQKSGASAAKKKKHPRAKDKLAHFILSGDDGGQHLVSAPFLGPYAKEQVYPPAVFLHDYRQFFRSYRTCFLYWLRNVAVEDEAERARLFGRLLVSMASALDGESFDDLVSEIYEVPISARDDATDSLEWRFLAWLQKAR